MCQVPQKKSIIHSPDDALGTGSDRLQVLVSLQDGKLGVAHLDGVERVSRAAHVDWFILLWNLLLLILLLL